MKKSTKILSLILSVVTLLSVFSAATPVFAEEVTALTSENAENVNDVTVSSEETETEVNEEAEIVSEIEDMRTEYTKYFRMSDGSYMAAQYAQPIHYEEDGEWKEYDYSITEDKNADTAEKFVIENSDSEMSFPEEFSEDDAQIEVSAREYDIKFSPVVEKKLINKKAKVKDHKKLKSNEIIENFTEEAPIDESADKNAEKLKIDNQKSAIAYEDVYKNVDLEYEISSNQIKESIVLNSKQDKNKFEFTLDTDGLFPKKETDGSITLYEDKEFTKPVSSITTPFMYDANGEYSYDVTIDVKDKKGIYILTVKADNNWLNDKERKYPVVIDPSILLDVGRAKTYDCYVDNSQPSTAFPYDYYLYAGHSSLGKTRTFIKFDLPALPDKCAVIQNATIHFKQRSADTSSTKTYLNLYKVTSSWNNDYTVKWNAQPSFNENNAPVIDYAEIVSGSVQYDFDITKSVKEWYESESNNYGLALVSSNESVVNRAQLYSAENTAADIYPQISIRYRNNKGLEDYWSYSSYSNDTGGVAHVDNYTGNLVYEWPILLSVSEIMPLTLTGVFNTYCANTKYSAGKDSSAKTTIGKGYRLNVQQTVLPSSQYNLTGTAATNYPYVYTDADGTEHYIVKTTENGSTVYKDEDGLGLTLVTSSTESYKYRLRDKVGNRWYFNDKGNIFCIKDNNDNAIRIYYKSASNQTIDYITDGAGHKFTFAYDSSTGYVSSITDTAGRVTTFTQNSSGFLTKIKYADGNSCSASYYTGTNDNGFLKRVRNTNNGLLEFKYNSLSQVKSVQEYGKWGNDTTDYAGQLVAYNRSKYNTTVIRSAGIDGINKATTSSCGADDIVTTIQFDNEGKPTSQQVSLGSSTGEEIGASNVGYTSGSSTLGSANKVNSSASLGKNVVNLLKNGNLESTTNWTQVTDSAITGSSGTTSNSYIGKKGLYISNSAITSSATSYFRQNISGVTVGKSYTLSAYVRVCSITKKFSSNKTGAFIQLQAYDSSGNDLKTVYSERLTAVTSTDINNGWRRLTVTMNVPANTATLRAYLCFKDCTGKVYFDGVQLEEGVEVNPFNMVENSSFESYSSYMPTNWAKAGSFSVTTSSGTVTEGCSTEFFKNGGYSVKFDGNASQSRGITQTIPVQSNDSDTYILSGWAKADAVNHTYHNNTTFEIAARVNYTCVDSSGNSTTVTQVKTPAKFNTTISEWQYAVTPIVLKYTNPASGKTYTPVSITLVPRYNYQENYAYFDHIQLIKDVASTYTYDNDGNLISSASNAEQKHNMEYDDNGNLTSYTDTAGNKSTATYDSKNNLVSTKSAKGVLTKNAYTAQGNVEATAIKTSDESLAIRTSRIYNSETTANGFTLKAGAQVTEDRDQHGYKTKYTYDHKTGALTSAAVQVSDTGYVTTNYSYDSKFMKQTKVTTDNTSVAYSYTKDRLTGITYSGTDGKSETYSFTYDRYGNVLNTKVGNQALSTNTYGSNNGVLNETEYGNGSKKQYLYTNTGLVLAIKHNDTIKYEWKYRSDGTHLAHTDKENSLVYMYDYDSLGRLSRQKIQSTSGTHVGSTEIAYDVRNNVTKIASEFGGYTASDVYLYSSDSGNADASSYTKDNLVSRYKINGSSTRYIDYKYDGLNRLTKKSFVFDSTTKNSEYTYYASNRGSGYTTTQIDTEKLDNVAYKYYYDKVGNVTSVTKNSGAYRTYTYDNKNQLTKEVNNSNNVTTAFTYDSLGNITKKVQSGAVSKTINYRYGNDGKTGWNSLLTGVNLDGDFNSDGTPNYETNETITYDAIGNPTTYLGASLTWFGRQLKSYSGTVNGVATSVSYTYDADGLRGTKSVTQNNVTTKSTYHNVGGQLRYETRGSQRFYYYYDATGSLSAIRYYDANGNDSIYFVLTNTHGDVMSIYSKTGVLVASYEYDAWGNCTLTTHVSGETIGELNPIRYRGYYYDTETDLYYLQSRYYNANVGRFLNADGYVSTGQDITGYNMFVYCGNNPVDRFDTSGTRYCEATSVSKEQSYERRYACYWQRQVTLEKYNPKPIGSYAKGNVYLVTDPNEILTSFSNDIIVVDNRGPGLDDNVEIRYSFLITNQELQREILTLLCNYEQENPTGWNRTVDSMMIEWDIHNEGAFIGNYVPFGGKLYAKSIHACFDNNSEGWSKWDHYVDGARKVFG